MQNSGAFGFACTQVDRQRTFPGQSMVFRIACQIIRPSVFQAEQADVSKNLTCDHIIGCRPAVFVHQLNRQLNRICSVR